MEWFRGHLNWTTVFSFLLSAVVCFLAQAMMYAADPWVGQDAVFVVGFLATCIVLVPTWGWVLWMKGRSVGWLLLAILVPLGWICMFTLENKRMVI